MPSLRNHAKTGMYQQPNYSRLKKPKLPHLEITASHAYSEQPEPRELLQSRRTAVEPLFDLVAKALGATGRQKPLPLQRLDNVRTCVALATLTVQGAMIANSIWGWPLRNISTLATAFT